MDLRRLHFGKAMEELMRQRRSAMLDGAGEAIAAGDRRQPLERAEVELDFGNAAARQGYSTMRRARLDAHLRQPGSFRPGATVELGAIAIEVRTQLLLR